MEQKVDWKTEQQNVPHRRYNLLTQSWVLCSPHRAKRPWLGQVEKLPATTNPTYDPKCYLCPGNKRATSTDEHPTVNPPYTSTYVFPNDYSALLPPNPSSVAPEVSANNLLVSQEVSGTCKVVCFSPRHDLTLPIMEDKDVLDVVKTWTNEYKELSQRQDLAYVQIFENKGETMGCSNPHPHCQIWASSFIPQEPYNEEVSQREYSEKHAGHCLLCDYLQVETREKDRIVCQNEGFIVLVPYWAVWPFEVLVIALDHVGNLSQFTEKQQVLFADILKKVTVRYDNLFQCSFPYSMGLHQTPCGSEKRDYWHFHAHFYPPLLRSATVKKFMVGYEMLAESQRDLTAEQAATRLRDLSEIHYSKQ